MDPLVEPQRDINIRNNKILFPVQKCMGKVMHLILGMLSFVCPSRYKQQIKSLENNTILNNMLGLTFFNALGGIIVMLTNIKIANVLGPAIYGFYSYYLAVGEVGSTFVRYGRNKTMTRDLIQCPERFDSLISNTFVLSIANLLLFIIVSIVFSKQLDLEITLPVFLLLISPCLASIDFQPVYESLKQMSWHSIYHLFQKIVFFSAIWVILFIGGKLSLCNLAITLFISWAFVLVMQFREIIGGFHIRIFNEVSIDSLKILYRDNFIIALSCMTGVAFGPLIRMILKSFADEQSVGIYSAGMQIFVLSQFLINQIGRIGNPMMAEAGKKDCSIALRRKFCRRYLSVMLLCSFPFAAALIFFPDFLTRVFYTAEYVDLGKYLPFFGIYLMAFAFGMVFTQFLISVRKDKTYFTIYVITAIITVVVSYLIIPSLGVLGAVIALCIPHSIGCFAYGLFSINSLKESK